MFFLKGLHLLKKEIFRKNKEKSYKDRWRASALRFQKNFIFIFFCHLEGATIVFLCLACIKSAPKDEKGVEGL